MKKLLIVITLPLFFYANNNDLKIKVDKTVTYEGVKAKIVKFGGYDTPECKLAISTNGKYFYLKKVNSTCKKDINSKGINIICNSNKSICKTRPELIEAVQKSLYSNNDVKLKFGENKTFGKIKAKIVKFGGYNTPECKLAISLDGKYFYLKKVNSTCKKDINSKNVKIICNSDKSICKTRQELIDFINTSNEQTAEDSVIPSWCNSGKLNKTEHMICANENLGKLDIELAKIYGATKVHISDNEQKQWLKKRNLCKADITCIRKTYQDRISQLKEHQDKKETQKNLNQTLEKTLEIRCKSGNANDCVSLGILYNVGTDEYSIDKHKAFSLYKKGCQLGSAKGCAYLGIMYANGEGVSKDLKSALHYLEKGCNKGHEKACSNAQEVRRILSNAFRGIRKNECYKIKEYGPKHVCLNGTGGDACYGIQDYEMQRVCREGAGGDACYGIKDYGMQRVCREGIGTDACYGLKDYKKQQSCKHFKGSTEFWLILAHYGYYTH